MQSTGLRGGSAVLGQLRFVVNRGTGVIVFHPPGVPQVPDVHLQALRACSKSFLKLILEAEADGHGAAFEPEVVRTARARSITDRMELCRPSVATPQHQFSRK
jgi:hypothetical protein